MSTPTPAPNKHPLRDCPNTNTKGHKHDELILLARSLIRKTAKYFGPMLNRMTFRPDPHIPTLATNAGGVCVYNPDLIERHNIHQVAWMITHEALHLFLHHFKRGRGLDPRKFNVNGDRAINPICDELGFQKPNFKVCYPQDINQPNGLTAEEYYAADTQEDGGGGGGGGGIGDGDCGSCSGHSNDSEAGEGDEDNRSQVDMERGAKQMADQAAQQAKGQGKVPGGIVKHIADVLAPARVSWQDQLAAAVRSAYQYRQGLSIFRFDGPAKKQAAIGWGEGVPLLPRLRSPVPDVKLAIDTSGSMWYGPEIPDSLSEVAAILQYLQMPVEILVCDAEVHNIGKAMDIEKVKSMLKGGGGTSFVPVFEKLVEMKKCDVLVYFTDGAGEYPDMKPQGMEVIWVLVGRHVMQPPWGTVIRVDPAGN